MGDPLDKHIGGLGLLGVDHMDIVVLLDGTGAAGHAVGIEHQNEHAFLVALIVAQNVHQLAAGGVQAFLCQCVQLVPRKDDVVAVHQQILRGNFPLLCGKIRAFGLLHRTERRQRVPLDGAVGALKNFEQFGILFQRSAVGHGAALGHSLHLRAGGLCLAPAAFHVHMAAHLAPRHHKASTMGAEHGICGVFQIMLRLVAAFCNDLLCIVTGAVTVQRQTQVSPAPGVADHLHGVAAHGGYRRKAGQSCGLRAAFRRIKTALHALDIAHGAADVLHRHFQSEGVPRL